VKDGTLFYTPDYIWSLVYTAGILWVWDNIIVRPIKWLVTLIRPVIHHSTVNIFSGREKISKIEKIMLPWKINITTNLKFLIINPVIKREAQPFSAMPPNCWWT